MKHSIALACTILFWADNTRAFTPQYKIFRPLTQLHLKIPLVGSKSNNEVSESKSSLPSGFLNGVKDTSISSEPQTPPQNVMGDLTKLLRKDEEQPAYDVQKQEIDVNMLAVVGASLALLVLVGSSTHVVDTSFLQSPSETIASVQRFFEDPTASLEGVVSTVESMGPAGALYFGVVYTVAEVLAIPAFPLTASAGYLFGVVKGTSVVLASASIAAAVSFVIGRTILRSYVETLLEEYPDFKKIDKAIGKEGFKLMLLLRLSPVFPFALSNYLYGATSVGFWPYFWGTMLGFTPGTIAYVYSGEVGKALTLGDGTAQPWYIYLGGFVLLSGFLKVLADVATGIIEDIEE